MSIVTQREWLIGLAAAVLEQLHGEAFSPVLESVASGPPDSERANRDAVTNALSAALDWARLEKQVNESGVSEVPEGAGPVDVPYYPSNQILSLLQSAYEEYHESRSATAEDLAEVPFDTSDPGWLTVAYEKLKEFLRGKHKFVAHTSLTSFQDDLPRNAIVALFSDWGTGEPTAQRVMDQIKLKQPNLAIHLGDVYYSGTPKEAQERFLNVIEGHGPSKDSCRYFSLNANHDMYSGGYGYFDTILPALGQNASYFNLRNQFWQLIGVDSGYEDFGLQDPQKEWLAAQLAAAGPRSIVMSHHQLFSPYEARVADRTLLKKVNSLLPSVYAWFWGHEHKCIVFGEYLGIKARCIGHGAIPSNVPYGTPPFAGVPIQEVDERAAPPPDGGAIHGFALLRFNDGIVDVSYIDEFGGEFFVERFGA